MSDIDLVIECCKKLSQEGKKPTSALIKYRLNSKVSFPTIIQGIFTKSVNIRAYS